MILTDLGSCFATALVVLNIVNHLKVIPIGREIQVVDLTEFNIVESL